MIRLRSRPSTLDDGGDHDNWLRSVHRSHLRAGGLRQCCCLCGSRADLMPICSDCKEDLPWRSARQRRLTYIDAIWACFDFAYPIRQLIHRAKYGRDLASARLLGELAAERLDALMPAARGATLYPVPLASGRMVVRGFNQAMEIALPIAKRHYLPIDEVSIYKPRARRTQSTLDAKSRQANIRNAFRVHASIETNTAIIIDDVLTTGATVSAMARTLKSAGVDEVITWVVAAV